MLVILSCCMIAVRVEQAVIRTQPVDTQILDVRVIVGAAVHINFQGQPNHQTELKGLSERNDTPFSFGCSLCLETNALGVGNWFVSFTVTEMHGNTRRWCAAGAASRGGTLQC